MYHTIWNHFPADYNFKHLSVATSGATRYSEVTFYTRQLYFCSLCLPYACNNVELLRGKHQKTKHCDLFLLLLIGNYIYFKNSENFATGSYLMYWGRDTGGIVSLWVIFEVLTAVCVKRAVVLVVTQCGLIEIYHPFFFYHEVRSGRFLHFNGGNRASCFLQNVCKFLPDFISREIKFLKNKELCNRCSAVCNFFTFSRWMGQCCPIKCTSFPSKKENICSGNLKWIVLSCNRNFEF